MNPTRIDVALDAVRARVGAAGLHPEDVELGLKVGRGDRLVEGLEPSLAVESLGLDDQRVSLPRADRMTCPGGLKILRMSAAISTG